MSSEAERALEQARRLDTSTVAMLKRWRMPEFRDELALAPAAVRAYVEGLEAAVLRCADACAEQGALDVLVARDDVERRRLWQARRICSPSLREAHRHKIAEDIAVPRGAIPEMLRRVELIAARYELPVATFGHAGDGNLHVNFLCDEDWHLAPVARRIDGAREALFTETVALRGTLSGEHGIGLSKMKYMSIEQSASLIDWQKRLKRLWDPRNLMNPGKIFP